MKSNKTLTVIVEKTGTGFSCYAKEIDGLATVGESISELKCNFNEVLQYHVDYLNEQGQDVFFNNYAINYMLDLEQFFDYFNVINKSAFAEHYAEINQSLFRQYTRKLAPLSDNKIKQISKGLHKLADELADLSFS